MRALRVVVVLLVLALAGCGRGGGAAVEGGSAVTPEEATQQAEVAVAQLLEAAAPGRSVRPAEGSGRVGPPCDPDGPVRRSTFVGVVADLQETDDPRGIVAAARDHLQAAGFDIVSERLDPPQQGVEAVDAAGGSYGLRIVERAGTVVAWANTPCLEVDEATGAEPGGGAGRGSDASVGVGSDGSAGGDLAAELVSLADEVAPSAPVRVEDLPCAGGAAVQVAVSFDDVGSAEAATDAVVSRWGSSGAALREELLDDGTRTYERTDGGRVLQVVHVSGSSQLLLAAMEGCEET
jgi:predicted small lipoprotein YifL